MSVTIGHHINGEVVLLGGAKMPVYEPATGQVRAEVELASPEGVAKAVAAAKAAFPSWSSTPVTRRAKVMFNFKAIIEIGRAHV